MGLTHAFCFFFLAGFSLAESGLEDSIAHRSDIITKVIRRETSIQHLPNLPTLPPATYCTQTLSDGKELLVTKTGATCPSYGHSKPAMPSPEVPNLVNTPEGEQPDDRCFKYQEQVTDINGKVTWKPVDGDVGLDMCNDYCGAKMKKLGDQGKIANAICYATGNPIHWDKFNADRQIALGKCRCNSPLLSEIVDDFVTKGLPAIAEITCKVWFTAISSVVQIGLNALPGVGQAIGAGITLTYQAAQVAAYTFENEEQAANGFNTWVQNPSSTAMDPSNWLLDKVCGNKYTPPEAEKIFGTFNMASSAIGIGSLWKGALKPWPPPYPRGSGSTDDMLDYLAALGGKPRPKGGKPPHHESSLPKNHAGKTDSPKTNPHKTKPHKSETTAKSCTRKHGRRAPGNGKDDKCDQITVTEILHSRTIENAEQPEPVTCDWVAWPNACAHYYSAIHDDPDNKGKSRFTCEDNNARVNQDYTKHWGDQHQDVWRRFRNEEYVFNGKDQKNNDKRPLNCEADEWPPAYFVPREGKGQPDWGQRIRYIPKEENGGAASLWTGFCAEHDGGKLNAQRIRGPKRDKQRRIIEDMDEFSTVAINTKMLKDKKLPESERHIGKDGKVTEVYKELVYTRAVFEMHFNFGEKPPSKDNHWMLRENPCWPQDIVPEDPGFVLLANDPYYKENKEAKATVAAYAKPPSRERFDEANEHRLKRLGKGHKVGDEGVAAADEPPPKAPKLNPPSGSRGRRRRERLEIVGDRLHLRNDDFNVTRPLTEDELKYNVEVTQCADKKCSRELADQAEGHDGLLIPGADTPSVPSANTAIPTLVTKVVGPVHEKRSALSAGLPLITPALDS